MKNLSKILSWALGKRPNPDSPPPSVATLQKFRPPEIMPGVVALADKLAMDDACGSSYAYANTSFCDFQGFIGYPALSELSQLPEYRMLAEKPAEAMTRKWVKLTSKGKGDKTEVIAKLMDAMDKFRVKELFNEAAKMDGFFGSCHLYFDTGDSENPEELKMPLIKDKAKIKVGGLKSIKLIEPIYAYPWKYNTSNPLADDYFKPRAWMIMAKEVHESRLVHFVSRPVPNLLKPSYNFGGLSMSQLARPYVDNWLNMRRDVRQIVKTFSTTGLKTSMSDTLADPDCGGDSLMARVQLFAELRENRGILLMDNNTSSPEELVQIVTPLGGLSELQAQSQEHLSSVGGTPLSVLLGITPAGLNASSEGEIRIYYDRIKSDQQTLFAGPLRTVLDIIQLSEFGQIDQDITFEFVSLWEQDAAEMATIRKTDADRDIAYIEAGVLSTDEARARLASDPDSGYTGLAGTAPELTPPEEESAGEEEDQPYDQAA